MGSTIDWSVPPTETVVSTAAVKLLTCTLSAPVSDTPGSPTATVPLRLAANPAEVTSSAPWPSVTDSTAVVPATKLSEALASPARTTTAPAESTPRSNVMSAVRLCPATVKVAARTSTRRYGPAGRSPTAAAPVLTATARPPVKVIPVIAVVSWETVRRPATPAAVIVRSPATPVAVSRFVGPVAVMARVPPEAAIRVLLTPPIVTRATSTVVKLIDWPPMVRLSGPPVTRTYWLPVTVLSPRLREPEKASPGTVMLKVPDRVAVIASVASTKVSDPVPPVKDAIGAPPSANWRLRLATVTVKPVPVRVNARSAVSCWPRTATVRPTPLTDTWSVPDAETWAAVNRIVTSPEPSANATVSSTSASKALTRTTNAPLTATPGKPVRATVPRASSA